VRKLIEQYIEINKNKIELAWKKLSVQLNSLSKIEHPRMTRPEISFHDGIKLLGYLSDLVSDLEGDILEIGVWKGKSLFFMERFSIVGKVIGIDPCEFQNQVTEINFYKDGLKSNINLVRDYSETALPQLLKISSRLKLIHIDGGHLEKNIIWDFMLYSPLLVTGGFLIFDDYADTEFSPEVKPAVDLLNKNGFFKNYEIIGTICEFPNSFIMRKSR